MARAVQFESGNNKITQNDFDGKDIILEKGKIKTPTDKKIKCRVTDIIKSQVFITC